MKKKLLLIALPALMVLSGCSNALVEQPVKINDADIIQEDNLAHEELFGDAKLAPNKLGVPEQDPLDNPEWTKAPKVGVQFKSYKKAETDYFAVRYVAAIADTAGMTATWSRGVSEKNSNQIKSMSGGHVSSVKYDSLNNDSTPVNATSEGTGLEKYIVYTMYDIPASQDESYIAAYLTLSKEGEENVVSRVVVTQIDGSHYFSLDGINMPKHGYFLENDGTILSQDESADTDPTNEAKDNAMFDDVLLTSGQPLGLFRFTPTVFQFYGRETFVDSSASRFVKSTTVDQYGEVYLSGTYDIYMNKDNLAYFTPESVDTPLYLVPNDNWKQDGDGHAPRFAVYAYGASDTDWFDMEETAADSGIYKIKDDAKIELGKYTTVIFCRMNGNDDKLDNVWGNKYNQTKDLVINGPTGPSNMSQLKYSVEGWDNGNGSWSAL